MQIDFTLLTSTDDRLFAILEMAHKLPGPAFNRLVRALDKAGQEIVGKAVKERFTGKGPFPKGENKLGVKTGRLRRAIRSTKPQINVRTGTLTMSYGANVIYFNIHEFGYQGDVQVKAHTRRILNPGKPNSRGKLSKKYQERLKKNLRAGRKTTAQVRAHKRKLKISARAPLGTQLRHVSTRAAYLRNVREQLEPMLRKGR